MKKKIVALILSLTIVLGGCVSLNEGIDSTTSFNPNTSSNHIPGHPNLPNGSNDTGDSSTPETPDAPDTPVNPGCQHVDSDNNGKCDTCFGTVKVTFDFFALNDLHGKFADTDAQPGVDELTTYLKSAKKENGNTIFLSSGDMWQGSSESNLTKGKIITDWMNELDFAAMTLGNHEFDWGEDYIKANYEIAEFPFLALNIYDNETNSLVDYCQPSVMVEKSGVKIGIIGAIGDCYSSISGDKVQDIYFKTGSQLTALVKAESQKLRTAGADFIVYSIHDGYGSSSSSTTTVSDSSIASYYDVALSNGYVDLVFEGHTHQRYVLKDSKGVYHLQDGGDNDGISHVEVAINYVNDSYTVSEAKFVSTSVYENSHADDPIVNALLTKYEKEIALAGKVLGKNDRVRDGDELRQIIADEYYRVGVEKWGDQYDIVLGGGYQGIRSPYDLKAGEITYGDVQAIFPFDNQLVLCSISGSKLKSQFFESTNSNYFIGYGEYGASVKNNINAGKTYYIVTDTYSSTFAPNGLTEIERYDETTFARDLLAAYIERGGMTAGENPSYTLTSIPDLLTIAGALSDNEETLQQYFVKGRVISIDNATYGNMYIEDESGNQFYIYGIYDATGSIRYDKMNPQPKIGDTVIVEGKLKKYAYNGIVKLEMVNGKVHSIE